MSKLYVMEVYGGRRSETPYNINRSIQIEVSDKCGLQPVTVYYRNF
jgi:hypothetical protein